MSDGITHIGECEFRHHGKSTIPALAGNFPSICFVKHSIGILWEQLPTAGHRPHHGPAKWQPQTIAFISAP
jgi:hypothetical protein